MLEDEIGSNRVKDAKNREDAYLERKVMEGDNDPMRVKLNQPIVGPGSVEVSKSQDAKNLFFSKLTKQNDPAPSAIKAGNSQEIMRPEPSNWDEALKENNFHEIVNDDADMYEQIDDDNMANSIMTSVRHHISEVWSPPRVTGLAHESGLSPGFSYDIQTAATSLSADRAGAVLAVN